MTDLSKLKLGENVSQEVLNEISDNMFISNHARFRLNQRGTFKTDEDIKAAIRKPVLAYMNTDRSINVAIDRMNYFVFAQNKKHNNYTMITFKEPSHNSIDIFKKQKLAQLGISRKIN